MVRDLGRESANTRGMRFIPLSDHAGELLRQARRSRAGAGKRDEERYRLALAAYDRSVSEARERRGQALAHWRLPSALRWGVAAWRRKRAGPPSPPADRGPSRNEATLEAGAEGEREVHAALEAALDDSWALFKGYRNRAGEIDYLLIGPLGLFAIEVKYVNGAFRITPRQWLYRRSDSYGNEVGDVTTLADRGGRPPQLQLAEPLEQLERFIAKRGQPVPWRSVVLLNHPRAKIISCADGMGAQVITSSRELVDLVLSADGDVGSGQVAEIGRLIERDHRFQAERRRSGTK
jgi:Nuclease-related domain